MKNLLLWAGDVDRTSKIKISRRRLTEYVENFHQKACRTCSTITFPRSTNQGIDLWRCRCRRRFLGCFPLCQRFRKFRLEFKWKGPFWFRPTGIFGITSGGGPLISVGIFRSKFAVPFLTNRFFALIREFGNDQK